ncbi:hypothetical protein WA158_006697 [Blastocystis sp. Blastoise]
MSTNYSLLSIYPFELILQYLPNNFHIPTGITLSDDSTLEYITLYESGSQKNISNKLRSSSAGLLKVLPAVFEDIPAKYISRFFSISDEKKFNISDSLYNYILNVLTATPIVTLFPQILVLPLSHQLFPQLLSSITKGCFRYIEAINITKEYNDDAFSLINLLTNHYNIHINTISIYSGYTSLSDEIVDVLLEAIDRDLFNSVISLSFKYTVVYIPNSKNEIKVHIKKNSKNCSIF